MRPVLQSPVLASLLAHELGLPWSGPDIAISEVAPLSVARPCALTFSTREVLPVIPTNVVVIATGGNVGRNNALTLAILESARPRLAFIKALVHLDRLGRFQQETGTAQIHETARIASHVSIGLGVTIGSGTRVEPHVRIADNVTIGRDCWIKTGAVIGESGFGFERDEDGTPVRMLHFGGVEIGDRVEIGALTTVCQGTLSATIIRDDAKVDDHVHVAHNVRIERKAMVIAHAELSGSVVVGEAAWVGPRACVREQLKIGAGALVGIGAVVVKDVAAGTTVCGNPAHLLEKKQSEPPKI